MPLYEYLCVKCEEEQEHVFPMDTRPEAVPCDCGSMAQWRISAPALHTLATYSADIRDEHVLRTRDPGDGSYEDPNLCDPKTGKSIRIKSRKHREEVMTSLGLQERPMSDKAKDVQRLKQRKPIHFHN